MIDVVGSGSVLPLYLVEDEYGCELAVRLEPLLIELVLRVKGVKRPHALQKPCLCGECYLCGQI